MSRSKLTFAKRERERSKSLKQQAKREKRSLKKDDVDNNEDFEDGTDTFVGKVVFSLSSGKGRITAISQMDGGGDDFYVINFQDSSAVDYSRVDGTPNFRMLAQEEEFEEAIAVLKAKRDAVIFESKKDRIHYFKDLQDQHDILSLVRLIQEMSMISDLGMVEKKILQRCIDSFVQEYTIQKGLETTESKERVESLIDA